MKNLIYIQYNRRFSDLDHTQEATPGTDCAEPRVTAREMRTRRILPPRTLTMTCVNRVLQTAEVFLRILQCTRLGQKVR